MQNTAWHTREIADIVRQFSTNATQGITQSEVEHRQEVHGKNAIVRENKDTLFKRLFRQLKTPIAIVLIGAGLAALALGELIDTIVIIIALLVNIIIGIIQEGRAKRSFEALTETETKTAMIIRDGRRFEVPINEVVAGDLVTLTAGNSVPADVRLVQATDLASNEASLTGEWVAVPKETGILPGHTPVASRHNMVFRGTTIVSGQGKGIVVAVGPQTQVGKIAEELDVDTNTKTPLERNMAGVAQFLLFIVLGFAALIVLLGVLRGEPLADMVLIAIAIAVAAIPEGLPAAVTASLALGMERILKHGGLVRNLLAAETLGTTTFILTDKTGTLTKGNMSLVEYALLGDRTKEVSGSHVEELLSAAVLASDATIEEHEEGGEVVVHGRPIEKAIMLAGVHAGIVHGSLSTKERLAFVPFSSDRRYGGAVIRNEKTSETDLILTGAPETLLEHSTQVFDGATVRSMTPGDHQMFKRYLEEYASSGLRVIAVSTRTLHGEDPEAVREHPDDAAEELTFMGLLVFADAVRDDVPEALARIKEAGARVVIVTGDNPNTARYVGHEVGLAAKDDKVLTGTDIEKMSDRELLQALHSVDVFARVLPKQKLRISRVLQNDGEVVAMTGDGINDAPALQSATIGVAVGSGTDVAKEASDLILLNNSFSIIVRAIEEGRRLRDNIKKIIAFLLSTNFSGTFIVGGALLLALPLPVLPTQVLWANIVGSGLMNFAFAFEPKDPKTLHRGPRDPEIVNVLSRHVIQLIIKAGLVTGVVLLVLFIYLLHADVDIDRARTIIFVALSMDALFFAFSMKSFTTPLWRINIFSNWYLIVALGISLLVLLSALVLPPLQLLLSTVPLSAQDLGILAVLAMINVLTIEIVKATFSADKPKVVSS